MAKITRVTDLLIEELKDLYSAESQILKALPKLAKAAANEQLRTAFNTHLQQTGEHLKRLETIGQRLDCSLKGKVCKAMEGLVAEGREIIDEDAAPLLHDLALIAAAQRVEHYEIAGYGTARALAEAVGETQIVALLQKTLDEEKASDETLARLAAVGVEEAVEAGEMS